MQARKANGPCAAITVELTLEKQMTWTVIMLCFWGASAALGAFLFIVVKPKMREFKELGKKEQERLWAMMDQLAQRYASLRLLGPLVTQEQRVFEELQGAASLRALERGARDFQNAGFLLVALEVDAGTLEASLNLLRAKHGFVFYNCFLASTSASARRMISCARLLKMELLAREQTKKGPVINQCA